MTEPHARYNFDRVVRMLLSAVGLTVVILLLRYLSDVLVPFVLAVVLAYLLNPVVNFLERKIGRRGLAVALTVIGLAFAGALVVLIIVPLSISQVRRLVRDLDRLQMDVTSSWQSAEPPSTVPGQADGSADSSGAVKTEAGFKEAWAAWTEYRSTAVQLPRAERLRKLRERLSGTFAGTMLEKAIQYVRSQEFNALLVDLAKRVAVGGWTVVAFLINVVLALVGVILVVVYLVFLLIDFPEYQRTWKTFLPPNYRVAIVDFLEQFDAAMRRYFRGQSVVALLTGVLFAVGFTIIGLPMAIPLGLFMGLLNMVPYLQAVGLVPALLLAGIRVLESDASFLVMGLLVFGVFIAVQILQDTLITPNVMGKATGLRPVAILLGVFIWGKLLGFLGLLLAIPLTCLGIAYYRRYVLMQSAAAVRVGNE